MKTLSSICLLFLALTAWAQDNPLSELKYSALYDFKTKSTIPVIGFKLGELDLGWKMPNPEFWTLAGYNLDEGTGSIGGALVQPFKVGKNATLFVGPAVLFTERRPTSLAFVIGAQVRLR